MRLLAPARVDPAVARRTLTWGSAAAMGLLALASVAIGVRRALSDAQEFGSKDFQWSPTRLLLEGTDPYQASLDGSPDIILTQSPNYLHLLYEVLAPFGLMPFDAARAAWAVLTVGLAVGLALVYARTAALGRAGTALLVAGLLASTPMRLGLSVGQHAVFLLAAATVAFACSERTWAGLPLALAVTKYSFAPLGLVVLAAGRVRTALVAGGVLLASVAVFAIVTSTGFLDAATAPFRVASGAVGSGATDLMTVAGLTSGLDGDEPAVAVLAVAAAVVLTVVARRRIRRGDWVFGLGVAAVISLLCFKHLAHDLVFLLPVVVLALRMRGVRALGAWVVLAWHGFVVGVISELGTSYDTPWVVLVSVALTGALLGLLVTDPDATGALRTAPREAGAVTPRA